MATHGCTPCHGCGAWCFLCGGCKCEKEYFMPVVTRPSLKSLADALCADIIKCINVELSSYKLNVLSLPAKDFELLKWFGYIDSKTQFKDSETIYGFCNYPVSADIIKDDSMERGEGQFECITNDASYPKLFTFSFINFKEKLKDFQIDQDPNYKKNVDLDSISNLWNAPPNKRYSPLADLPKRSPEQFNKDFEIARKKAQKKIEERGNPYSGKVTKVKKQFKQICTYADELSNTLNNLESRGFKIEYILPAGDYQDRASPCNDVRFWVVYK